STAPVPQTLPTKPSACVAAQPNPTQRSPSTAPMPPTDSDRPTTPRPSLPLPNPSDFPPFAPPAPQKSTGTAAPASKTSFPPADPARLSHPRQSRQSLPSAAAPNSTSSLAC